MLSFGLYYRKLIFFAGLFLLVAGGITYYSQQYSQASIREISPFGAATGFYNIEVEIFENSQTTINNEKTSGLLHLQKNYDEFRWLVVDSPGQYIDFLNIEVLFPEGISQNEIEPLVYAIHGVGNYNYYFKDSRTLVYQAQEISPQASFTIIARFPKGGIDFPFWQDFFFKISSLPLSVWLIISLVLPLSTLIILIFTFLRTANIWRRKKSKETINRPPADLAPALAGVLLEGKVSARSIASTLFDLAHRDYLTIINKGNKYDFGKKQPIDFFHPEKTEGLKTFEKILLSKIFAPGSIKSTQEDIQVRIGHHVFSRKIAEVYLAIYEDVTRRGFFRRNPSLVHLHWRRLGLVLFFTGLIGFIFGIWLAPEPKFLLFFWVTMVFSALLIVKISPQFPPLTPLGLRAREQWLQFKNFLIENSPIGYQEETQEIFEKYLPYAVAFGCEAEWARRFFDFPFRPPEWFTSSKPVVIIEDFITGLFPVISYIGQELARSKEPIVE